MVKMAATHDTRETTISDLPPEVLSHIFAYLPRNIRVVRLVCSKWNESCNDEAVSGHEKIFVRRRENEKELFSAKQLQRNIFNLCLSGVRLRTDHVSFFKKFGRKLRSLKLEDCAADENAPFLQYCKNLNTLTSIKCCPSIVQSFRRSDGNFVQSSIVSLTLQDCPSWSDETMDACFRICPRLRSLALQDIPLKAFSLAEKRFYSFKDGEEHVFRRLDIFSFGCIYHALSVRAANLVELNLAGIDGVPPGHIEKIASIPNLKLRKLKLTYHGSLTDRNICNIVTQQPDLRDITIRRCRETRLNGSADWIEKCSMLTRLEIEPFIFEPDSPIFDERLFNALASRSNLRELVLKTNDYLDVRLPSDFGNNRTTFDQLRTLELSLKFADYDRVLGKVSVNLQRLCLKHPNLEFAGGAKISIETLKFVCHRFTNLETLNLALEDNSEELRYWDFDPEQISLGSFEKLNALRVKAPDIRCCPASLLQRFEAPNLKFLELQGFNMVNAASLDNIVKYYPSLERFKLWTVSDIHPEALRVMSDWKRLSYFQLGGIEFLQLHQRTGNEDKFDSLLESYAPFFIYS